MSQDAVGFEAPPQGEGNDLNMGVDDSEGGLAPYTVANTPVHPRCELLPLSDRAPLVGNLIDHLTDDHALFIARSPTQEENAEEEEDVGGMCYSRGYGKGYDKGYKERYTPAYQEAYDKAFKLAYDEAYALVTSKEYQLGYSEGLEQGREQGRALGLAQGHEQAKEQGRDQGFQKGFEDKYPSPEEKFVGTLSGANCEERH